MFPRQQAHWLGIKHRSLFECLLERQVRDKGLDPGDQVLVDR